MVATEVSHQANFSTQFPETHIFTLKSKYKEGRDFQDMVKVVFWRQHQRLVMIAVLESHSPDIISTQLSCSEDGKSD